jgi:hypothetical protein
VATRRAARETVGPLNPRLLVVGFFCSRGNWAPAARNQLTIHGGLTSTACRTILRYPRSLTRKAPLESCSETGKLNPGTGLHPVALMPVMVLTSSINVRYFLVPFARLVPSTNAEKVLYFQRGLDS